MVRRPETAGLREFRRLFQGGSLAGLSESELLERFAADGDEAAFEAIVRRLPDDLRERYTEFVIRTCGEAAEASGGWLWFGSKVGDEEKKLLDQIAAALGCRPD